MGVERTWRLRGRRAGAGSAPSNRRLAAGPGLALAVANLRYWSSVWPLVRRELRRWERVAREIEDDALRGLALRKLRHEAFNAEVAATLATLAPRRQREPTVTAIVALELLFDYLDGLTETRPGESSRDADRLFSAFTDALDPGAVQRSDYFGGHAGDGGYLNALSSTVRDAIATLPGAGAIGEQAHRSAARCAQAQIRIHRAPTLGVEQLKEWAEGEGRRTGFAWRELAAGAASSVLAVHALIAAAADGATTREQAAGIEAAYLPICVLITLLDSLVDHEEDMRRDEPGFLQFYENLDLLPVALAQTTARAAALAAGLPHAAHHLMTLAGVVAYYTSAPAARGKIAGPVSLRLRRELSPLIYPALGVMRGWRAAKRTRAVLRHGRGEAG